MKRTTVLLADDHALVLEGLHRVLQPDFDVVGGVANGIALVKATKELKPDIVIVDVSMPLLNGIEGARRIRAANHQTNIIFLSMHPEVVYVVEAMRAGGLAYVLKSSAGMEIVTAIHAVLQGETFISAAINKVTVEAQIKRGRRSSEKAGRLSPRRRAVVQMVAEGHSTKEIASILHISPRTVEFHRYKAMESLGLHSLADLVHYAIVHRIVPRQPILGAPKTTT
jgi:DNA-binding NarL/FixJ family response regulator